MIAPISAMIDSGVPVSHNARNVPVKASGMVNMMMKGNPSDSNCVAMTM